LNFDAFSSGQVQSKLWLVRELEEFLSKEGTAKKYHIWILGGWYGVTNFIIRTRGQIPISKVRSFDCDPECEPIADKINDLWVWQDWQFKALTQDINNLDWSDPPDIVINTSVEHIHGRAWYDSIPSGTILALQSTDMPHEDHHHTYAGLDEFTADWNLSAAPVKKVKVFEYDDWGFRRFLAIGRKP
jgi:hypothetical protein